MITEAENLSRVHIFIQTFLAKNKSKYFVALDFDELLVEGHLSKHITNNLQPTRWRGDILKEYGEGTFDGMAALSTHTLDGYTPEESIKLKQELIEQIPWKKDALELLTYLQKNTDYSPLIISCGRYQPQRMKLDSANLSEIPIIATQVDHCALNDAINLQVISTEIKGTIIEKIKKSGNFEVIYAVGHDEKDEYMIEAADVGIIIKANPPITSLEEKAQYSLNDLKSVLDILKYREASTH